MPGGDTGAEGAPALAYDTSVWVEYLKRTESDADLHLAAHLEADRPVLIPEIVRMELLQHPTDELGLLRRTRLLDSFPVLGLEPLVDSDRAAAIQRECRLRGTPVRNLLDCLIAAIALRLDVPVAHRDRDFEQIARLTGLRTVDLSGPRASSS